MLDAMAVPPRVAGDELSADPRPTVIVYAAVPASPSAGALTLLATWSATQDQAEVAPAATDNA